MTDFNVNESTRKFDRMFTALNEKFFNSELPMPMFTIDRSGKNKNNPIKSSGHKLWRDISKGNYEFNVSARVMELPIDIICSELLRAMVHEYCNIVGIKDVSSGDEYHNKKFKMVAESHGLICARGKYGWNKIVLSNEAFNWVVGNDVFSDIGIHRVEQSVLNISCADIMPIHAKKGHFIHYTCKCGKEQTWLYGTKHHSNIWCHTCWSELIEVD